SRSEEVAGGAGRQGGECAASGALEGAGEEPAPLRQRQGGELPGQPDPHLRQDEAEGGAPGGDSRTVAPQDQGEDGGPQSQGHGAVDRAMGGGRGADERQSGRQGQ